MELSFIGAALWGAILLGIVPLLIHLISRRRARRVSFGAIEFILAGKRKMSRHIYLRQLLLLLVRTLLVVLLVGAFLQPLLQHAENSTRSDTPNGVFILIDKTASMRATHKGVSLFSQSVQMAEDELNDISTNTRVGLLACGKKVDEVVSIPTFDRAVLLEALGQIEAEYSGGTLPPCIDRAHSLLEAAALPGPHRVMVFSDLASHAFSDDEITPPANPSQIEWVHPFPESSISNQGLHSVYTSAQIQHREHFLEVHYTISQTNGVATETTVDLVGDSRTIVRQVAALAPNDASQQTLTFGLQSLMPDSVSPRDVDPNLIQEAQVRLQIPSDAYRLDDRVEIPVAFPPSFHVVIVNGDPQAVPFRDEVFYIEGALRNDKPTWAQMRLSIVTGGLVAQGILADAQVVVLANVASMEPSASRALVDFVQAGGGVLITMGDQVNAEWANQNWRELLPGTLRGEKAQELLDDNMIQPSLTMNHFDIEHPAFQALVQQGKTTLAGLARVKTQKTMLLEPDPNAPRQVLISFSDQTPALVERRVGKGKVLLLATSIDRDWSDLSIRPGFVPLINHLMLYLGGISQKQRTPFISPETEIDVLLPQRTQRATLRFPDGKRKQYTENDFQQDLDKSTRSKTLRITSHQQPGLYRIYVSQKGGNEQELVEERFVVMPPKAESNLTRAPKEALQDILPTGATGRLRDTSLVDDIAIWPWLFLLAALCLLVEGFLLRRS
jgi:hypothetical protein